MRRSALTLAESGNLLTMRTRARDQGDWVKDANRLADVGRAAYTAAQAKDLSALPQLTESLDASCTTCHKQYRPNVFPRGGEDRNELFAQKFPESCRIGRGPDGGGRGAVFLAAAPPALAAPMTKEKAQFIINGKLHVAEYEARTTLWEVIAIQARNDRNQSKLQPGQLRRVQRGGGRNARSIPATRWRPKLRARRFSPSKAWVMKRICTLCSGSATRTSPRTAASARPDGWLPRKRFWTRILIRPSTT